MDEELEQPKKKITLSNFFESIKSIDAVANNALKIANSNISIIQEQKSIIQGLSQSLEALQTEVQEINNYIIIEKNEREDRRFEEEDRRQKEEMSQRRAAEGEKGERGPRGPQGTQGESEEKKEPQQPQGGGGGGILGAIGGVFGGLRDALGPLALNLGANIFTGFRGGGPIGAIAGALGFGRSGAKGFEAQDKLRNRRENLFGDNQKITKPRGLTGIFGGMADALTGGRTDFDGRGSGEKENVKEEIKSEIKEELNLSGGAKDGEGPIITSKKLNTRFDIKTGKAYVNGQEVDPQRYAEFKRLSKEEQVDQGLDFFNEDTKDTKDIKSQNKSKNLKGEKRGIKGVIGGVADSLTGGFFDFDKRGDTKLQDFAQGTADTFTGGVFDFDEKGSTKLQRFGQGFTDAVTGNLTDLDRKGGKTVGPTRAATGMIDFATANMFDLDKRGGLDLFGFGKRRKKRQKSNYDENPRVIANKNKIDELRRKKNQIPMETTVNPDGSITSKGSGTLIGGELYKPGEEMSLRQRQSTQFKIMMNGEDSVDPQRLKDYKNSGGALSKEEASVISDFEGVEPGAFTEVSDEEAKRQIEAEDNPFASILSPFVDKFKNFSEGLEKSSLGESLKDEKIPKQLESVAKDIGSKIDPKDIKDVVIKTVVKKLFGDIEPGAFSPVSDEDIEKEKQLESDGKTFELSGASKKLIGEDEDFLKAVTEVSEKRGINQAEFLGLMASESSLDPKAVNKDTGATGLIQFLPEVAERLGTTTDKILEMSRTDQVKLIDKYFDVNKLPDNPTAGQLKTNVLMPAYTDKGDDFELMTKNKKFTDGEAGNPNTFSQNKGLDYNEDGFVTVGEAGQSIFKKMEEFGIKDTTPQKGGINAVIENKVEDLSQNILSNFEEISSIGNSQPQIDPDAVLQINESFQTQNQGATRDSSLLQPTLAQVSEASLKDTETTSIFVQTISNNKINIAKKTVLPSEIARMII